MYRNSETHQISLFDFNQSFGTPLDAANPWVIRAGQIDWAAMEAKYASLFSTETGRPAAPFRMVLGSLIIQEQLGLSDRALVRALTEDPYLQYFIGQSQYEKRAPFTAGSLSKFRRRFGREYVQEINAMLPEGLSLPAVARVGLVFTTHTDSLVNEVERCVRAELGAAAEIVSRGDASILDEVVAAGHVTPQAASRLVRMYLDAMDAGCDAVLNVCSSVGEVADAMQELAAMTGIPIVRIDEEMCRRAVREGSGACRIAVMATLPSTLNPTRRLLQRCAAQESCSIELVDVLVDNAFGLTPEPFAARLEEAARQHCTGCSAIVLAQASMSLCENRIREAAGLPVYSSPRSGAWALRQALDAGSAR